MMQQPIRDDEDDVLSRLEGRLEQVASVVSRLKKRNEELERMLLESREALEQASAEASEARRLADQLNAEAEGLRERQKTAAQRIRNLLAQVEQVDLLSEN